MSISMRQAQSIYDNMLPEDDTIVQIHIDNIIGRETIDFLEDKVDWQTWEKIMQALTKTAIDEIAQEEEDERWGNDWEMYYE